MKRWFRRAPPAPVAPSDRTALAAAGPTDVGTPDAGWAGWTVPWPLLVLWGVLWGVETGHWLAMVLVIAVIALPAVVQVRWSFSPRWHRRAFWAVGIGVSVLGTYAWLDKLSNGPVWFIVAWLPVLLLPLLAEDRWGAERSPLSTLPPLIKAWPWSTRPTPRPAMSRERWRHWAFQWPHRYSLPVVVYPRAVYAGLVWASVLASATQPWALVVALLSGVWGLKSTPGLDRRPWGEWLVFLLLMLALGGAGMAGMRWTQGWIEQTGMRWLFNHRTSSGWFDASHADTRIGQTGSLDDGDGLRFRILWDRPPNTHLPVAVYDVVTNSGIQWSVSRRLSNTEPLKGKGGLHVLPGAPAIPVASLNNLPPLLRQQLLQADKAAATPEPTPHGLVTIPSHAPHVFATGPEHQAILSGDLSRDMHGRVPLPVPTNTRVLMGMDTAALAQNAAGSVLATNQGSLDLRATYVPDDYLNLQPPSPDDQRVPAELEAPLDEALGESGASGQDTPDQAAQRLRHWFQTRYHYTLSLTDPAGDARSLTAFLTRDREGHCEYFATATVLMLRRLGIPARYVTGVLVNEAHPEEDPHMYWVRDRHFHAWVVYWNGEGWKTLDTTPPDLGATWAAATPWYNGLNNAWLHWQYVLGNLNVDAWATGGTLPALALVVVLVLWLAWRQRHRFQTAGGGWLRRRTRSNDPGLPATEVAFEQRLARALSEHPRRGEEPWGIWARRVGDPRWQQEVAAHYQHRYGTPEPVLVEPVPEDDGQHLAPDKGKPEGKP